jgi:hypothetical protein
MLVFPLALLRRSRTLGLSLSTSEETLDEKVWKAANIYVRRPTDVKKASESRQMSLSVEENEKQRA